MEVLRSKNIISVVMPTYNAEKYVAEAIESVLNQTFNNFEFIIVDDGSTDSTKSIIQSFKDNRIKLIENEHNFIASLNIGINNASGKYIARMDADDIMHRERLATQYATMEEPLNITVCSSWINVFGENIHEDTIVSSLFGLVECPLLYFLNKNVLFHPTVMIRSDFLRKYSLQYENYEYAEDFKLWVEIAKCGGTFYVDSQPFLSYRISSRQVSNQKKEEQKRTTIQIRKEVLSYLLQQNNDRFQSLSLMSDGMVSMIEEELLTDNDVLNVFDYIFNKNKRKLNY